jgi:oxygen-independent coproporphyrinogen-3 oxidase
MVTARPSLSLPPLSLPPLSLYVHLPWCVAKCPYCDFNSYTLHGELPEAAYIDALLSDLAAQLPQLERREIGSVFFGGGTPSLFSPPGMARLLDGLQRELEFSAELEITLEANPGTIEHGRFSDYRAAGINRVSLGAQSFSAESLRLLGRIHSAEDTRRAVRELRAAGIDNFNLDLMYALPRQELAAALFDLDCALELEPTHISHYELTLEPGTVFGGVPPQGLPDADRAMEIQLACQQRLADNGYAQYEVSAYALEARRCRHNLNYWRFGDYLGLGAGAHGKCTRQLQGSLHIERTWREREPRRYLGNAHTAPARRTVPSADLPFEYLMNALRLREGFEPDEFEQRTGLTAAVLLPTLSRLEARGLMEQQGERWRASPRGYHFLNDVIGEFLVKPVGNT